MLIKRIIAVGFCFFLLSSVPSTINTTHSLKSDIYIGRPIHISVEEYTALGELVSEAPLDESEVEHSSFPILINFDLVLLKEYVFTYGYLRKPEQGFGQFSAERIQFSDVNLGSVSMIKATLWDYVRPPHQSEAAAYYPHNGNLSTASFIFPFLSIFKGHEAPYYQEITQRAKPTHNILPNQKGNQPIIKGENITFYHLDRNDGYIETYGFRKPKGNELKGVEQILVLQAIYPAAQMTELAGPLKELFVQEVQQHQAVWGY